jgi:glycosyltransferase involved in cell wall biosynthesis
MKDNYLPSLSIVTPCFNEEENIENSIEKLLSTLEDLSKKNLINYEHSFIRVVDDGSSDKSWFMLKKMHEANPKIHGIKLSRNFGHQSALLSGILSSTEDLVITIDIDLQDDIRAMEKMLEENRNGYEIVYGIKEDRSADSLIKNFFASCFYSLLAIMGASVLKNHADFRLLSKKVITVLREYKENNLYLRGIIPIIGFKSTSVKYKLNPRALGKSKYIYKKSLALAINGITSFSLAPLRYIGFIGFLIALSSMFITAYFLFQAFFTDNIIPDWVPTVLPIYFLGAIQLISLGVISEYLGKLFLQSKNRPNYIIEEVLK